MLSLFKRITNDATAIATAHIIRNMPPTTIPPMLGVSATPNMAENAELYKDVPKDNAPPYITKLNTNIITPTPAQTYENRDFCLVSIVNTSPKTDNENAIIAGTRARFINGIKLFAPNSAAAVFPEKTDTTEPAEAIVPMDPISIKRLSKTSAPLITLLIRSMVLGAKFKLKPADGVAWGAPN